MRVIAIDWSGAQAGAGRKIWLAEVADGHLIRLEDGRNRHETDYPVKKAERDLELVVGLDFAFSLPAWFLKKHGLNEARELWALAERETEAWLAACESPFWGRPGKKRPDLLDHLHRTDREVPSTAGIRPKSVFQIGGAGAVGTESLRGMPLLSHLHSAGFSVWPFDPPAWPMIVEIYPRLLTGPMNKGSACERMAYMTRCYADDGTMLALVGSSEDAFDAAISALVMARHLEDFAAPRAATDEKTMVGGEDLAPFHASLKCGEFEPSVAGGE